MQTIKNKKKEIILLIATLLVCFIILELVVRLTWKDQRNDYPLEMYLKDNAKAYKHNPGFNGTFIINAYKNIPININSKGLRDEEHNYRKDNRERILFIGDSVTFGAGIKAEESYPKIIEKEFDKENISIETINAGTSGYNIEQEYNYYFEELYKYDADVVVIGVVLNDIEKFDVKKVQENWFKNKRTNYKTVIADLCKSCKFFYSLINDLKKSRAEYNEEYWKRIYSYWQNETLFNDYKTRLMEINKNVTSSNHKLVLVLIPYTQQFKNSENYGTFPQDKIKSIAKENNIQVIDLLNIMDKPNYLDYYFNMDNVHPTSQGHEMMAEEIFKYLNKTA